MGESLRPSEVVVFGGKKPRLSDLAFLSPPPWRRRQCSRNRITDSPSNAMASKGKATAGTSLEGGWREEDSTEEMLAGKVCIEVMEVLAAGGAGGGGVGGGEE